MIIAVNRQFLLPDRTIGEMLLDGAHFAWTMEDACREKGAWQSSFKIPGQTAIPSGWYEVTLTMSNRFKRMLPLLLKVPDFEAIRIHGGNGPQDVEGCIAIGSDRDDSRIWNSAVKVDALVALIQGSQTVSKVWCAVNNP